MRHQITPGDLPGFRFGEVSKEILEKGLNILQKGNTENGNIPIDMTITLGDEINIDKLQPGTRDTEKTLNVKVSEGTFFKAFEEFFSEQPNSTGNNQIQFKWTLNGLALKYFVLLMNQAQGRATQQEGAKLEQHVMVSKDEKGTSVKVHVFESGH